MAQVQASKYPETTELLTGNHAVSAAVKLARPGVIAAYPITPQTEIVEKLSVWCETGELDADFIAVESEHSALAAAMGISLAGVRTFTATASHGLLYMIELVWWAGLTRIPVVMTIVNRSLNPWNIWPAHEDSMSCRDCGWIQLYAKNNQEAFDNTLMQFKLSEDHKVWLPSMSCIDGFILSHTTSPVNIPAQEAVDEFLGDFDPLVMLDSADPFAHGSLTFPAGIIELRESLMKGHDSVRKIWPSVCQDYRDLTGRWYGDFLEIHKDPKEANIGVMALGTLGEEMEQSVDILNQRGIKAVSIRPRVFRPFPDDEIVDVLSDLEKVVIIDRASSYGAGHFDRDQGGQLATEIKAALYDADVKIDVYPLVRGLGGDSVNYVDIAEWVEKYAQR
ncbi:MAG: pyruvate ferredoxin oxidoreductase [Candidatus Hodarchaeales archaeon]